VKPEYSRITPPRPEEYLLESAFQSPYYDPPRMKWWWLFLAICVLDFLISLLTRLQLGNQVSNWLLNFWAIYFCIWLRRIVPDSVALRWVLLSAAIDLTDYLPLPANIAWMGYARTFLDFVGIVCFVIGIFTVRRDLQRHYNQREDFSLRLGPFMTLFFSFLYFQYHLYDIAEARQQERQRAVPST
jgi:hypothetical protein